jgi:hypothetical protein
MGNLRLIKIVKLDDGTVAFQPNTSGGQPHQPMRVNKGDRIHWNNETDDDHWPEGRNPAKFLTDSIPGGEVSNPGFVVQGAVGERVEYMCKLHQNERGTIEVVAPATASVRRRKTSQKPRPRPRSKKKARKRVP